MTARRAYSGQQEQSLTLLSSSSAAATPTLGPTVYADANDFLLQKNRDASTQFVTQGWASVLNTDNAQTTVAPVGAHTQSVPPGTYYFEWRGQYLCAATTYGIRLSMAFTSGTLTRFNCNTLVSATAGGSPVANAAIGTTSPATPSGLSTGPTVATPFQLDGMIIVTATGNLQFRHAPSSSGTTTILAGSVARISRIV